MIVFYLLTALPSAAARLPRYQQDLASKFPLAPLCWRSAVPGDGEPLKHQSRASLYTPGLGPGSALPEGLTSGQSLRCCSRWWPGR